MGALAVVWRRLEAGVRRRDRRGPGRGWGRRMGSRNLAEVLRGDRRMEIRCMVRLMGEGRAVVRRRVDGRMEDVRREEGLRSGDGRGHMGDGRREAAHKAGVRTAAGRSRSMKPLYSWKSYANKRERKHARKSRGTSPV